MSDRFSSGVMAPRCMMLLVALLPVVVGCSTGRIEAARDYYYSGRLNAASRILADVNDGARENEVLFRMERGTIYQSAGAYALSAADYLKAISRLEELRTYSVSHGAASMIINDAVQDFQGFPYERTLLHAFAAKSYLAMGQWDDSAVEGRLIVRSMDPSRRGEFPEEAYSHYLAGVTFQVQDNPDGAALEFRKASALLQARKISVDEKTGWILQEGDAVPDRVKNGAELICLIDLGRAARGEDIANYQWPPDYQVIPEVYAGGKRLGRGYILADTVDLARTSELKMSALRMAKTVTRIALKEEISREVERRNAFAGFLVRTFLYSVEEPDTRRWETLPRYLAVARVACPSDLKEFDVVLTSSSGTELSRFTVTKPIVRRRNQYISICRNLVVRDELSTVVAKP